MELIVDDAGDTVTLRVVGEVTSEACGKLRDELLALAPRSLETIYVDLSEMPFIDSSGLGVFVGVRGHLKKKNTRLILVNPQKQVVRIFNLMKLSKIFGLEG